MLNNNKESAKVHFSFKNLIATVTNHELFGGAAQLAYSLIMALIPLVMFIITIAGRFNLPIEDIYSYLDFLLPDMAFNVVGGILSEILNSSNWTLATIFSALYFISIGTRGFMRCSNRIYGTQDRRSPIFSWLISFVFAALIVVVLFMAMVLVVFGGQLMDLLADFLHWDIVDAISVVKNILTFVVMWLILCLIYSVAPNKRLYFKDVYVGAFISALIWIIGSVLYGFYINNFSNYGVLFGSLGGIFILLAWMYFTSYILLLGAYLNANKKNIIWIDE